MSGSTFGKLFRISTWGESHGKSLGVVVDGCPAGIPLTPADIQADLNRRKPGGSAFATKRTEPDAADILSGVCEDKTTGTPIAIMINNTDQRPASYDNIKDCYRPGHADFGYDKKYGFRDYRGGGRSSGRGTAARVAGGAVARRFLSELGVSVTAYTLSIGPVCIDMERFDVAELKNPLCMPDREAYNKAAAYLQECIERLDSAGGVVECVIRGLKPGFGEPVFDKLDARLGQAILSIGGVKGVEFGAGFKAAEMLGSVNNDSFCLKSPGGKLTNNAGGITGGISDGAEIILRAAFKPTPSIGQPQRTINNHGEDINLTVNGRHDPIIVPRAVVVVECMAAITVADMILQGLSANIENVKKVYGLFT